MTEEEIKQRQVSLPHQHITAVGATETPIVQSRKRLLFVTRLRLVTALVVASVRESL